MNVYVHLHLYLWNKASHNIVWMFFSLQNYIIITILYWKSICSIETAKYETYQQTIHSLINQTGSLTRMIPRRPREKHDELVLLYYASLRYEYRVVMSVTISAYKLCSVRLYLPPPSPQLFVGLLMSYFRCLCLLVHSGIQHILCCIFSFVCLPMVC